MFGFGFGELVLIAVIGLIFIGPKELPNVARTVARFINEIKRATEDLTGQFVDARDDVDRKAKEASRKFTDATFGEVKKLITEEPQPTKKAPGSETQPKA